MTYLLNDLDTFEDGHAYALKPGFVHTHAPREPTPDDQTALLKEAVHLLRISTAVADTTRKLQENQLMEVTKQLGDMKALVQAQGRLSVGMQSQLAGNGVKKGASVPPSDILTHVSPPRNTSTEAAAENLQKLQGVPRIVSWEYGGPQCKLLGG
mmetsp:Transcript_20734/g.51105  ORF Transcript_20734/g.51105 Transcript_20734/m.51105 type:complete len:154 (-) Transcript_20734:224-685(-)